MALAVLIPAIVGVPLDLPSLAIAQTAPAGATVVLTRTTRLKLPGEADSNSPVVWDLVSGTNTVHVLTSVAGWPSRSVGRSLTRLRPAEQVHVEGTRGGVWMEAVLPDEAGTWYGFYHNEVKAYGCGDTEKMSPRIGMARSTDQGAGWGDLGIILDAPLLASDCQTPNRYFTGGVGDFSVALDADSRDVYIFYSQYLRRSVDQGVAMARLPWADRDEPKGKVAVWREGVWAPARSVLIGDPDRGQRVYWRYPVGTPLYPAAESWHDDDLEVDAFWGPSVHWNTHLRRHVMLLNRARDVEWRQDGVYVAFSGDLSNPAAWSVPQKILSGGRWYPQVIGLEPGTGTDKVAGEIARLFISGESDYLIRFVAPR
jgi:hypothetical protein